MPRSYKPTKRRFGIIPWERHCVFIYKPVCFEDVFRDLSGCIYLLNINYPYKWITHPTPPTWRLRAGACANQRHVKAKIIHIICISHFDALVWEVSEIDERKILQGTHFTQSGHGLMVCQAQRACSKDNMKLNLKLKLKTLSGLRLMKTLISQLSFILLKQMLRKIMLSNRQCAKTKLQKRGIQWSKRLWVKFSKLFLKYNSP